MNHTVHSQLPHLTLPLAHSQSSSDNRFIMSSQGETSGVGDKLLTPEQVWTIMHSCIIIASLITVCLTSFSLLVSDQIY